MTDTMTSRERLFTQAYPIRALSGWPGEAETVFLEFAG